MEYAICLAFGVLIGGTAVQFFHAVRKWKIVRDWKKRMIDAIHEETDNGGGA